MDIRDRGIEEVKWGFDMSLEVSVLKYMIRMRFKTPFNCLNIPS